MELQNILSSQTVSREDRKYVLKTFRTQALLRHNPSQEQIAKMDADLSPSLPGLSPISENDTPTKRDRKLSLLSRVSKFRHAQSPIEAPIEKPAEGKVDFGHSWNFWHDKHAASGDYEGRLTLMQEDIDNIKLFWQVINSFPFERLGYKDSVHFFKKGVKPVWEDPRNVNGGAWNFRVPKEKTDEFWKELLVLAVGETFHDVLQNVPNVPQGVPKRDDICGLSLSIRYGNNLISIWHRDGTNEKSVEGIKTVILEKLSPQLIPQSNYIYHKIHASHPGFDEAIAKNKEAEKARSPLSATESVNSAESKSPEGAPGKESMDKAMT
ncbi:hypothetical protein JMJ35_009929 [Cladonia borealis]|uniref:Translation initiation factor eIF4e n=1 Tax=Cladonia borealis TaxID=184061 RepID=A0AA39QU02_9LECA|nr:hypothetical protein JMJ35_009929 [Cladonia borealis]